MSYLRDFIPLCPVVVDPDCVKPTHQFHKLYEMGILKDIMNRSGIVLFRLRNASGKMVVRCLFSVDDRSVVSIQSFQLPRGVFKVDSVTKAYDPRLLIGALVFYEEMREAAQENSSAVVFKEDTKEQMLKVLPPEIKQFSHLLDEMRDCSTKSGEELLCDLSLFCDNMLQRVVGEMKEKADEIDEMIEKCEPMQDSDEDSSSGEYDDDSSDEEYRSSTVRSYYENRNMGLADYKLLFLIEPKDEQSVPKLFIQNAHRCVVAQHAGREIQDGTMSAGTFTTPSDANTFVQLMYGRKLETVCTKKMCVMATQARHADFRTLLEDFVLEFMHRIARGELGKRRAATGTESQWAAPEVTQGGVAQTSSQADNAHCHKKDPRNYEDHAEVCYPLYSKRPEARLHRRSVRKAIAAGRRGNHRRPADEEQGAVSLSNRLQNRIKANVL